MRVNRWYLRCQGCLAIVAIEESPEIRNRRPAYQCAACGSPFDEMGRVFGGVLLRDMGERCACDARCTGANGPSCDCQCGGENHGTGRTVPVVRCLGAAPVIQTPDPETARARRNEWQAARASALERIGRRFGWVLSVEDSGGTLYAAKRERWLDGSAYDTFLDGSREVAAVNRALGLKTHGGRMKAIQKVAAGA